MGEEEGMGGGLDGWGGGGKGGGYLGYENRIQEPRARRSVFFRKRHVEGLLRSIRDCAPNLVAAKTFDVALRAANPLSR